MKITIKEFWEDVRNNGNLVKDKKRWILRACDKDLTKLTDSELEYLTECLWMLYELEKMLKREDSKCMKAYRKIGHEMYLREKEYEETV